MPHTPKTTSASNSKTLPTSKPPLHASKPLIDIDNMGVAIGGHTLIEGISFCIHPGELIGVIGPNGAGKTTLLKTMLGLWKPTTGRVTTAGARMGYVPQRGFMADNQVPMNVLEVVQLGSRGNTTIAREALATVDMQEAARQRFSELSGGQQQRVLIAKALAGKPDLLVLDEPTTGIDAQSEAEFSRVIAELPKTGMSVLMVSHDVDSVLQSVSRVICLNRSVLYDGPPEHFEADRYLPKFYAAQHRALHHQHGGHHA